MAESCDINRLNSLNQEILKEYTQEQLAKVKLFLSSEQGSDLLRFDGENYSEATKRFILKLNGISETALNVEEKRLIKFFWASCYGQKE